MFRRPPTRIELKMDNAKEFEEAKAEREAALQSANQSSLDATPGPSNASSSSSPAAAPLARNKAQVAALIQQRIGFRPQPIAQVSHLPTPPQ